ncbi:unnamed protein product [Lathyrus oleraceus]
MATNIKYACFFIAILCIAYGSNQGGAFDAPKHCHPVGNCPDDNRGCVDYCEERGFPEGSGKCQKHDQLCCCN